MPDYLVANAPADLRIAVSLRPDGSFADAGLLATLLMMRITTRELKLHEEETAALVHQLLASTPKSAICWRPRQSMASRRSAPITRSA